MIRSPHKSSLAAGLLCAAITAVLAVAVVVPVQAAAPAAPAAPAAAAPAAAPAAPASTTPEAFAKDADGKPIGRKVIYAVHSLQWDTPNPMAEVAKAAGIKGHEILAVQRNGFSTATQIWDAGAQTKAAIEAGKVDDLFFSIMEVPDDAIEKFVALQEKGNPKGRVFIQNNWTAFNADGQYQHRNGRGGGPGVSWDQTTVEQLKDLDTGYEKAIEVEVDKVNKKYDHQVAFIIPTSQGVTTLRTMIAKKEFKGIDKQSQIFADTIGHPAPPLIALNAYIHFATVYGMSPVGLPKPSVLANAKNLPDFNDASNKALQEIAWKVVQDYAKYDGVKVEEKR